MFMNLVSWPTLIFLCFMVGLAGFVDASAGGGGLISLPAYMVTGLPVHLLYGANKFSSACGTTFASAMFFRSGALDLQVALIAAAASFAGSVPPGADALARAQELAHKNHLEFSFEEQDIFPATENDALCASRVMRVCRGTLLHDPMRWSEDFGHYLHRCRGAFFGVGAGEDHPQIHTEHYEYPDALLEPTVEAFRALLTSE